MGRAQAYLALGAVSIVVGACAPIPVERAEALCLEEAELAVRPRGMVGIGVGSNGKPLSRFEVELSSNYIMGRDPSEVYNRCVFDKSGQLPTRPLYSRTDWKG